MEENDAMKRIIIVFLSLLLLFVCSCKKQTPDNLLLGTWEVQVSVRGGSAGIAGNGEPVVIIDNWIFTFEEDGHGMIEDAKDSRVSSPFTYQYHEKEGIIDYDMNGIRNKWIIDKLTRNEFHFHSLDDSSYAGIIADSAGSTFIGKRKK